jgi:hypothetical protein
MSHRAAVTYRKPLEMHGDGVQHECDMEREVPLPVRHKNLILKEKELEATSGIEPEYTDLQSAA